MEDVRRQEVRELARLTSNLDAAQQVFFQSEYSRHRRNPTTALLLCALLGDFGAHYFYFGRHRAGIVRLLFCWTLIPGIVALFEARTIGARATRYNASLANELVLAIRATVDGVLEPIHALTSLPEVHELAPIDTARALAAPSFAGDRARVPVGSGAPVAVDALLAADAAELGLGANHAGAAGRASLTTPPDQADVGDVGDVSDQTAEDRLIAAAWAGRDPDSWSLAMVPDAADPRTASATAGGSWGTGIESAADSSSDVAEVVLARHDAYWLADDDVPDAAAATLSGIPEDATPADDSWLLDNPAAAAGAWDDQDDVETPDAAGTENPSESSWGAGSSDAASHWRGDATPAIAAAAVSAAAAWVGAGSNTPPLNPEAAEVPAHTFATSWPFSDDRPASHDAYAPEAGDQRAPEPIAAADDAHEPVFMYQVAAPPRREAVHFAPPAETPFEWPHTTDYVGEPDHGGNGYVDDSPAGYYHDTAESASHPGSHVGEDIAYAALGTALAGGLVDLLRDRPGRRPAARLTTPLNDGETAPASDADSPRLTVTSAPQAYTEPGANLSWVPVERSMPQSPGDGAETPMPAITASALADVPMATALATPASVPLDTAAPMPQNVRRRLVQRVIVRKLAMLDGQVVAESAVERQVPVVSDDQAMAARVQAATLEAAREALSRLIREAPEEALPAIRMELYALDNQAFVQNVRRPGS